MSGAPEPREPNEWTATNMPDHAVVKSGAAPEQTIAEARDAILSVLEAGREAETVEGGALFVEGAIAALAALVARAAAAEQENERFKTQLTEGRAGERELQAQLVEEHRRAERAEAETQRLREALTQIASRKPVIKQIPINAKAWVDGVEREVVYAERLSDAEIARAALRGGGTPESEPAP